MINFRNQKGSITLFVLISCMFFVASVACVQMYMQSKKSAVDREYRQIKSNYEGNTLDENVLKENYEQLSNSKNINVTIVKSTISNNVLSVEFNVQNTNFDVKSIKYGWGTSESEDTVNQWNFIENNSIESTMYAINNEATEAKDYHLFIVINEQVTYSKITVMPNA